MAVTAGTGYSGVFRVGLHIENMDFFGNFSLPYC